MRPFCIKAKGADNQSQPLRGYYKRTGFYSLRSVTRCLLDNQLSFLYLRYSKRRYLKFYRCFNRFLRFRQR